MDHIQRILKLHECATFRQFTWPKTLPPFNRYNLIYGWNGSGKTTISNVLRCLEKRILPTASDVQLEIGTNTLRLSEFRNHTTTPIRVFNRDFVREHVFPDDGTLPPVFVLGDTSIKSQEELDSSKRQLAAVESNLTAARNRARKAKDDFEKFCINQAKAIKDSLQVSGVDPYRNYNQSHYKKCVAQFDQPEPPVFSALSDGRKAEISRILTQQLLDSIPILSSWSEFPQSHEPEVREILAESVVAQVIEVLRGNPALSTWIESGLLLHPENDRKTCKFCSQPMSSQRIVELEEHFNDEAEALKARVHAKIQTLETAKATMARKLPVKAELYPQFQSDFQEAAKAFSAAYNAQQREYDQMIGALREKALNLFVSASLAEPMLEMNDRTIDVLNTIIKRHNLESTQLNTTKANACKEWEHGAVYASHKEYKRKNAAGAEADKGVNLLTAEQEALEANIAILEASLREHRRPADELNNDLKSYLGHGDLNLEVHETGYRIKRGSVPADHLSEGERTAIAILYFLKSLEDSTFSLAEGVVVLDDPVSSLDERALYSAFSYIQSKTNQAGQVFILTHNFSFFRLVKRWFVSKNKNQTQGDPDNKSNFYMMECRSGSGDRNSTLAPLDKLLADYESDYQYLFSRVYEVAMQQPSESLESYYHIPNMARRLLESFLSFRSPHIKSGFRQLLEETRFDSQKIQRIYRFCHAFSHADRVPGTEHDPNVLSEAKEVMIDILELMNSTDAGHFNGLTRLCTLQRTS